MLRVNRLPLLYMSLQLAAGEDKAVSKRAVLTDLSGGFCRSYRFGANIVDDILYMIDLDGGIIPGDENGTHNYLTELDLSKSIDVDNGASYKLSLIPSDVPKLKDQALWSSSDNKTLFSYGGRGASDTSADDGLWTYTIANKSWQLQLTSIQPVRLVSGAYVDTPSIQAAYWLGGYQSSDTTLSITDATKIYATGMIQFNTTTQDLKSLGAPFTPVEQGALVFLPVGSRGILIYLGGEVPSIRNGINATLTPNTWDYVQVYDIAADKWYKQTTTGTVAARTQFCASVMHDPSSSSYQIYILGGADFTTEAVLSDVSYLSVPSFKWYQAKGLEEGRMTLSCEASGSQIFGIGGRFAWADDFSAGCYDVPAFIYDAQSETIKTRFDPALSNYSIPSATAEDIATSPYPSSWADPGLSKLFLPASSSSPHVPTNTSLPLDNGSDNDNGESTNTGAIAGGVVGGVAGVALIIGLIFLYLRSRRQKLQPQHDASDPNTTQPAGLPSKAFIGGELSAQNGVTELDVRDHTRNELEGDRFLAHELDASSTVSAPK